MLGAALNRHLGIEMIFQTLLDGGTNPRIGLRRLRLLRLLPRRNLHGDDFFGAAYRNVRELLPDVWKLEKSNTNPIGV